MPSYLHSLTPNLVVINARGMKIREVAYHRETPGQHADARSTCHVFDATGRAVAHRDARLPATSSAPNLTTAFSLSSQVLLRKSVDAGWCLRLHGAAAEIRCEWDGRLNQRQTEYDDALRPVAIIEHASSASPCVTERFTYAACSLVSAAHNQCTRLIRHNDPAGCRTYEDYGLLGQDLKLTQGFLRDLQTPHWPPSLSGRDALLEQDEHGTVLTWTTRWQYDATAKTLSHCDALGNTRFNEYDIAGQLAMVSLKPADQPRTTPLFQNMFYNALGQLHSQTLGNGIIATAIYSPVDGRLQQLRTVKANKVLQDLSHTYDPSGNVMSIENAAQPTDWFDGEQVDAVNHYVYDTLGQLIEARGRESVLAGFQPGLPGLVLPGGGDASRLRNYTQVFRYDEAGNLLSLKHGQLPKRLMNVDTFSNRSLYQADADNPPEINNSFDANGNLLRLEGAQTMHWDARNQLQRITQVVREDSANDDEVYVYGAGGQRQRKIRVHHAKAVENVAQVRYLPGLEIRTNTATGEVLHVTTLRVGRMNVRHLHWVAHGKAIPAPQWRFGVGNHLGSSTLELNEGGDVISHEDYYPYGGTAWWAARNQVDAAPKVIRYSGKECDASGLYYYGSRYYAPWLQRWINPDPLGEVDGLNLFVMVHNNPVAHVDVQGTITEPSQIAQAVGAGMMRDGVSSAMGATVRYFTAGALSSQPVTAASITAMTVAGALSGGVAGLYVGGGLGANIVANSRFRDSQAAVWAGAGVGGLLGAAAGAAPSILGYFGAMSSLNTAAPSHNQAAISQIGATANAMTREIFQQASAELGPRIAWNDRPRVSGLAGSSAIYGSSLAGIGAGQHLVPKAVSSIAGGTAGEMMGSAGGTLTRGLHPDAKFNPGKWELTNPVSAAKRQGTVHGVLTRMAVAATTAGLKMAIAQTGLEPGTQASGILDRSLGTLAEARVLTGSYVLEGAEALGFEGADINNDVTSMNPKRTWVASSNDASVRGTSFHLNQYV